MAYKHHHPICFLAQCSQHQVLEACRDVATGVAAVAACRRTLRSTHSCKPCEHLQGFKHITAEACRIPLVRANSVSKFASSADDSAADVRTATAFVNCVCVLQPIMNIVTCYFRMICMMSTSEQSWRAAIRSVIGRMHALQIPQVDQRNSHGAC